MVNLNNALLAAGAFATFAVAAPTQAAVFERDVKHADTVTCPITGVSNFGKTFKKDDIEADIKANPDPNNQNSGFPKEYRYSGSGGSWPFTKDTHCDDMKDKGDKIYEIPIGPSGQAWKTFGNNPGTYRVLFSLDGGDQIFCGVTAHASKTDFSKVVGCED
ncbi:Uu.00g108300.m01.CDS01 [Anthostomella pinea]|uniref:Uu.00g108300.m01.CDS01 n=1 Tax=Anthostomella pinea TaxID=933095 RepID=A0AAI8VEI0_9PEZI|nr:Uu.00g108300.m01.CDS01 [Anthostomella pinea]